MLLNRHLLGFWIHFLNEIFKLSWFTYSNDWKIGLVDGLVVENVSPEGKVDKPIFVYCENLLYTLPLAQKQVT